MSFGDHDQLALSPAEANALSDDFWKIYLASAYQDGYMRAIVREAYNNFQADFAAASAALTEETALYLGAKPPVTRPCPCRECKKNRETP